MGAGRSRAEADGVSVQLIGGFQVRWRDGDVGIPAGACRLVAFLALAQRPLERAYVANCLWLDKAEHRAQANLRSALWRLGKSPAEVVRATPTHLRLAPAVSVDVTAVVELARVLIEEASPVEDHQLDDSILGADLLPEWYDDFVEVERERLRQLRLHALEALSRRLCRLGRHARALDVGLAAVASDPLRETAHRTVIETHLAEGNVSEALRQYRLLAHILADQLAAAPSAAVRELVSPFLHAQRDLRSTAAV